MIESLQCDADVYLVLRIREKLVDMVVMFWDFCKMVYPILDCDLR